jgi:hypothetical protein
LEFQLLIRQENSDIASHPFPQKDAEMDGAPKQYLFAESIGLRNSSRAGKLLHLGPLALRGAP